MMLGVIITPPWQNTATFCPGVGRDDIFHALHNPDQACGRVDRIAAGRKFLPCRKILALQFFGRDVSAGGLVELHDAGMWTHRMASLCGEGFSRLDRPAHRARPTASIASIASHRATLVAWSCPRELRGGGGRIYALRAPVAHKYQFHLLPFRA